MATADEALAELNHAEPDWELVGKFPRLASQPKFVSGTNESDRIRIQFYKHVTTGRLVGKVWFGPNCEGPPGHAHGGAMAAVLDEIMGAVAWLHGHRVVAVRLETNFRKLLPIRSVYWFEASVDGTERKKVFTTGRIYRPGESDTCDAKGIFVQIDPARLKTSPA